MLMGNENFPVWRAGTEPCRWEGAVAQPSYDRALHERRSSVCVYALDLEPDLLGRSRLLHGQCEQTPQLPPNRQSRSVVGPRQ